MQQMPTHSGNRSWLFTTFAFCMRTSITGLRGAYFFLCVAFCVGLVPDGVECSSHLKCVRLKLNQKVLCELGLLWEQCVVSAWQRHAIRTIQPCAVLNCWFLVLNLYVCFDLGTWVVTRKVVFLNELYMTFSNTKIQNKPKNDII